jgi:hypothetical protein
LGALAGGGHGLVGGLVFDHQVRQQFPGAGELGEGRAELVVVFLVALAADAVVEGHLAHACGQRADEGGDAPAAGRGLPRGGGGEKITDGGRLVVHWVVAIPLRS